MHSLTHSKPLCVKGIPTEVRHIHRVLDGGESCVWQPAWLRALEEEMNKISLTHTQTHRLNLETLYSFSKSTCSIVFVLLPYLKDANLASGDGEGHRHTLAVDTETVRLAWCSQVEAPYVGNVCVSVHHGTLDVTELGGWPWIRDHFK